MQQLPIVMRVLAEINERIHTSLIAGDLSRQKAAVETYLRQATLTAELKSLVQSICEQLISIEDNDGFRNQLGLDKIFKVYVNRVHQDDMSEHELRKWLSRQLIQSFDILIKEGDPCIHFGVKEIPMRNTDTIKYRVLVCLLRTNDRSISFERLHESIGGPFVNENTSAGIRSRMGDNLKKILNQLPIRAKSGKRDWWTVENRHISLNPTLKTCLISPVTGSARDRMLRHVLATA